MNCLARHAVVIRKQTRLAKFAARHAEKCVSLLVPVGNVA
jgi:hypothetical protein